ncbi:MAG: PKD domain-containing protein [Bacteroidota bacterium]
MKKIYILIAFLWIGSFAFGQSLPIVDFTGFTGSNLSTISPGWSEGEGFTAPTGTSSQWTEDDFANVIANGSSAKINLFTTGDEDWIVSPMFTVQSGARLEYDFAITDFATTNPSQMGSDDLVEVRVSVDGGLNYSALRSYSDTSVVSAIGQHEIISLDQFTGQSIILAFFAYEGTVNDPEDYDVFVDNIEIINNAPIDLSVVSINSPTGPNCLSAAEQVSISIQNTGTSMLDFAANNTPVTVDVSGVGSFSLTASLTSGTLMPDSILEVVMGSTGDFSAPGLYTLTAYAKYPVDPAASNDTLAADVISLPVFPGPALEDFETFVDDGNFSGDGTGLMNGWINDPMGPTTAFNWSVNTGGSTSSSNTGPDADHTNGSGTYMYTESSRGSTGDQTTLLSPCLDVSGMINPGLSFWYHMYGTTIGALDVYIIEADGTETLIFSAQGPQQGSGTEPWRESVTNLASFSGPLQLKFIGTKGSSSTGDIAIDDVSVFELPTTNMEMTRIVNPNGTACYGAAEVVSVEVTNRGLATIDFAGTNMDINVSLNGIPSFSTTLSSGTLEVDSSLIVQVSNAADLSAPGTYDLLAYLSIADDGNLLNDTARASATTPTGAAGPILEDMESFTAGSPGTILNGWLNSTDDDGDWFVESDGTTNSSNTGPLDDHTPNGSLYIYYEATGGSTGDVSELTSPCIDLSALSNPRLGFWYHMHGEDMGTLEVFADGDAGRSLLFSISGEQQANETDPWIEAQASLTGLGSTVQLIFKSTRGADFTSDIAIDDIEIFDFAPIDLALIAISPNDLTCADSNATVNITLENAGSDSLDLATSPVSIDLEVTGGTNPQTFSGTLNSGGLSNGQSTVLSIAGVNFEGSTNYSLTAVVAAFTGNNNATNDTIRADVTVVPAVSTFPYTEGFENGDGGWTTSGINNSWELGEPANTLINAAAGGTNAWVTNLDGNYNVNENSEVTSPCFDLSNAPMGTVAALSIYWDAETSFDGAVIQYSTDLGTNWTNLGNQGDPNNWFNDGTISGNPGGQQIGWTGTGLSSSGQWLRAIQPLDSNILGQASVLFRVAFGSDFSVTDEGFGFDDFTLGVPPTVSLGADDTVCIGTMLDAGPGASYLWSTGETTRMISVQNDSARVLVQDYRVVVTDSLGLSGTDTVTLTINAGLPTVDAMVIVDSLCFGEQSGQINANASSVNGPIASYMWNTTPAQDSISAVGLSGGTYIVTVADSLGCTAMDTATVVELPEIIVALDTIVNVVCNGDSTGAISISVSGGVAPYSFLWSNGANMEDINGLPAGDYTGTITDAAGCMLTSPNLTVTETEPIMVVVDSLINPACDGDSTGGIFISVSGGNGAPYTFVWSNGDTTEDLSGIPTGSYTGMITDAEGCMVEATVDLMASPGSPVASFTFESAGSIIGFTNTSTGVDDNTTYVWDFGDGATDSIADPAHFYNSNDTFIVSLTITNGCGSSTATDTIFITTVGIEEDMLNNVSIYPNPSRGEFEVSFENLDLEDLRLSLISIDGKQVYTKEVGRIMGNYSEAIKLPATLARGVYVLQIQSDEAVVYKRIRLE